MKKERAYTQTQRIFSKQGEHQFSAQKCAIYISLNVSRMDIRYREGEKLEEQGELFSFSFMPMGGW